MTNPTQVYLSTVFGDTYSYSDTHRAALVWADAFERAGVRRGDAVATMLPTSEDGVFAWLGLAWLGAVEVPINTAYRGSMLRFILEDAGVALAVVASEFIERVLDVWDEGLTLSAVVLPDAKPHDVLPPSCIAGDVFLSGAQPRERSNPAVHDLAAVIYTSGTTGRSKGVMVPWRHMYQLATGLAPEGSLDEADVFYLPLPLFHGSGKGSLFLMALAGGSAVLRPYFSTEDFWPDIRRFGCTTTMLLGAMAQFINGRTPDPEDATSPLRNVLMVPVIPDVRRFIERFEVRVHTWYGITEAGVPVASSDWHLTPSSCGRARAGYQIRVVDEDDNPVPAGQAGELTIRADESWMLMRGYWRNAEATLQCWRNLWLHTGDTAYLSLAGDVHFVDRQKDAMRRRGENISSVEVEAETNEHPDVLETAAFAVAAPVGEDDVMIAVVLRPGSTLTEEELFDHLAARLPHFMVPRYIEVLSDLPRTPTQKVQKNLLRERGLSSTTWDREGAGIVLRRDSVSKRSRVRLNEVQEGPG